MNNINQLMNNLINAYNKQAIEPGDYYREADGILMCGKCHTPKQEDIMVDKSLSDSGSWRVPIPCECKKRKKAEENAYYEKQKFEIKMDRLKKEGISDSKYLDYTFSNDDLANPNYTKVCKNYVKEWDKMKQSNSGILLTGNVGTGKTYLAACIANALINQLVPVCITSFPKILNQLQNASATDRQAIFKKLNTYQLLVIDDLGTERDTTYSAEQIYNIIDTRMRSGKPVIITTNILISEMENTTDVSYRRIYDRVLEMCPIRLILKGQSRRKENASKKRAEALSLLWEEKNETDSE